MGVEEKLKQMGLVLPGPLHTPNGLRLPFSLVRISGRHVFVAGHGPQDPKGFLAQPLGKVGRELTVSQGYDAARLTALSMLGSLKRELRDLDRISAWLRVLGMVNSAPGFSEAPNVINGFSDLILELFGPEIGAHTRSSVGVAELGADIPVEIEAEVELRA